VIVSGLYVGCVGGRGLCVGGVSSLCDGCVGSTKAVLAGAGGRVVLLVGRDTGKLFRLVVIMFFCLDYDYVSVYIMLCCLYFCNVVFLLL
jgi:hypothetical protein